jgi:hypothetical protein
VSRASGHTLTAQATDTLGNVSTSTPVAVNTGLVMPAGTNLQWVVPTSCVVSGTITLGVRRGGVATGTYGYNFYRDGTLFQGLLCSSEDCSIYFDTKSITNGTHVFSATLNDLMGAQKGSAGNLSVSVQNVVTQPIIKPPAGRTLGVTGQ